MGKVPLPPISSSRGREKRKATATLPGSLSVYEPKQSKRGIDSKCKEKSKNKESEERLKLLHSRNKAYIQQLEEKSRQMRQQAEQESERVSAFRDRLRKRILKEVSQSSKDFAMMKAERMLKDKAEMMKQRADSKSSIHRNDSASPGGSLRNKFAAYRSASPGYSTIGHQQKVKRPTTSSGTESRSRSRVTGFENLKQLQRPQTSHPSKPRSEQVQRPNTAQDDSGEVAQGSGRQMVAKLRANRVISSAYASTPATTSPTATSPTFATTIKIYRSIQCNTNPSLKRYLMWKKRNNIAFEAKVFTISGEKNFFYMRRALLDRGWIENKDTNTEFFDLKWSLHSADIKHINLRQDQFVNHFEHASNITTKCGLLKTFKEHALSASVNASKFYPRSYELSTEEGKWEFDKDFEMTAALSILKRAWVDLHTGEKTRLDQTALVAMKAWTLRLQHERNLVVEDLEVDTTWLPKIRNLQWNEIRSSDIFSKPVVPKEVLDAAEKKVPVNRCSCPAQDEGTEVLVIEDSMSTDSSSASTQDVFQAPCPVAEANSSEGEVNSSESELDKLGKLLGEIYEKNHQSCMDGMHNIWIVKPGGKSRGRGIRCFNNLQEIWSYVRHDLTEKWVAQKYIERPLIVHRRKFDIRQWILVTDWNPLTVWMYGECYLRFAVESFDLLNLDAYIHLCNNSVVKHSERFDSAASEIESEGNMWSMERFERYVSEELGAGNAVREVILPQMRKIVTDSLRSAQWAVKDRKETCQVFGYDFLVDDSLNVWLLEINSSPTMEASNALTARLCREFQEDTVKVIVDLPAEQLRRQRSGEPRLKHDEAPKELVGNFEILVSDSVVARQPKYIGLNLVVEGKSLAKRFALERRKRRKSQIFLDRSDLNLQENKKDASPSKDLSSKKMVDNKPTKEPLQTAN